MPDPIRPEDKQRMSPIMEYCRILFDTQTYDFTIEYYDRENYRQEKHENLTVDKVAEMRDALVRDRWLYVTQYCQRVVMVFHYQRPKNIAP